MATEKEETVQIGSSALYYIADTDNKYVITYFVSNGYKPEITSIIDNLFNKIYPEYDTGKLKYSNVCGINTEKICESIKDIGFAGKVFITDWVKYDDNFTENKKSIENVYGNNNDVLMASYHALPFFEITLHRENYYVAIETVICTPYKLQFYVGNTYEELEEILKVRYQCKSVELTGNCNEAWYLHIKPSKKGGNKRNKTKRKKSVRRKRKTYRNKKKSVKSNINNETI
jgi:hypothetical protein